MPLDAATPLIVIGVMVVPGIVVRLLVMPLMVLVIPDIVSGMLVVIVTETPLTVVGLMVVPCIVVSPFVLPLITVPLRAAVLEKLWVLSLKVLAGIVLGLIVDPISVV